MPVDTQNLIYLDHNATTPADVQAIEAMMPYMKEAFGNPSSSYALGIQAKEGVEQARQCVARLLGCKSLEVVFTSGGSEANNMALKGVLDWKTPDRFHIITSAVEHPAVLNPLLFLMELGVHVTILPVDHFGRVDPDDVRKVIRPETALISIMLANNETGTLQPIQEISQIAREHDVPLHTDAAQAVGKIHVSVRDLGVDLLSVAGHKLYGPKGVGALFIREGLPLTPLIHGAGQEGGKRAGTENVILNVGLGAACRIAQERLQQDAQGMQMLRDRLHERLFQGIPKLVLNGHPKERLPNTLNISIPGVEGGRVLERLPTLCASTGAACHDKSVQLSHVLAAMAVPPEIGMGALRFSVGRRNTMSQIEEAADLIIGRVKECVS
jgi:cysteine desulfurase